MGIAGSFFMRKTDLCQIDSTQMWLLQRIHCCDQSVTNHILQAPRWLT